MATALFDELERTDASPALRSEDSFTFLNRAAGVVWARIRATLDGWYAAYPDADGDLRERFRSRRPDQHFAAWWELYLHALLTSLGFTLTVHPVVPDTDGHPDFLAERGDTSFYVEAVTVSSGIVAPNRRGALEAAVLDVLDTVDASQFMVGVNFERVGRSTPKTAAIKQPVEAWIATLDPDEILALEGGFSPEREHFEFDGWEISLRPIARTPEYRGCPDNRLVGLGPVTTGYTNDVPRLRSAITRKKKQFGTPNKALVVAALATGPVDPTAIESALFGSEAVQLNLETGQTRIVRQPDGVWVGKRGPSAKRVSAVLMGVEILPGTCATTLPRLWHHFDPTYTLDADLPFASATVVDDQLQVTDATSTAGAILGLPDDWPGPEPRFPRCAHRPGDHAR